MTTAFSQRDPRWSRERLGQSAWTLDDAGCLVTAMASLLADFGVDTDPGRLNAWLVEHDGYAEGCRLVFRALEPLGARLRAWVDYYATPANLVRIARALAAGWGALALVDARPGADVQAHWVRLLGIVDGTYGAALDCLIMDPWQLRGEEVGALSEWYGCKGWHGGRPIFVYVGYEFVNVAGAPADPDPGKAMARTPAALERVQEAVCWRTG